MLKKIKQSLLKAVAPKEKKSQKPVKEKKIKVTKPTKEKKVNLEFEA